MLRNLVMATILRLPRTDHAARLLLHVTRTGTNDLDLKLIGTDQEHLYHGSIKEASINSLQASNFSGDLQQWKSVLLFALLHQRSEGFLPDLLQGVETVAAISGSVVTVTIRKNIAGITQRLGTIKLEQDDEREQVGVFDWVDSAVATSDQLRSELGTLQDSVLQQRQELSRLQNELDNLIKAKKEHEDELLSKFAALLNSKKLKIRDQQRLLSGAKIDADAADEVSSARSSVGRPRHAGASGKNKRKARAAASPAEDGDGGQENVPAEDEDEDGIEDDAERRRQETPETDDEDVDEDELDAQPDGSGLTTGPDGSRTTGRMATRPHTRRSAERVEVDDLESGVGRRGQTGKAKAAKVATPPPTFTAATANEDDDETDDEL